jgi:hypothetical protein
MFQDGDPRPCGLEIHGELAPRPALSQSSQETHASNIGQFRAKMSGSARYSTRV